jgi:hypothetical protein
MPQEKNTGQEHVMNESPKERFPWVWMLILALAGAVLVVWSSALNGLGFVSDSVFYLQAAKHFATGYGFAQYSKAGFLEPMTHYPPVFPAVLAMFWMMGAGMADAALRLNALCAAAVVLFSGGVAFKISGRRSITVLAALFMLSSVQLIEVHLKLISEPFFLALLFAMVFALVSYVKEQQRLWLYAAVSLGALLVMTRYAGLAFVLAAALWLWRQAREQGRSRGDAIFFAVGATGLLFLWAVRGWLIAGTADGRVWSFYTPSIHKAGIFMDSLCSWIMPARIPTGLRWAVGIGFLLALVGLLRRIQQRPDPSGMMVRGVSLLGLMAGTYVVFGVIGSMVADNGLIFTQRIWTPFYALLLTALACAAPVSRMSGLDGRTSRRAFVVAVCFLMAVGFVRVAQLSLKFHRNGYGYTSRAWKDSKVIGTISTLDERVTLYSNDPLAAYYLSGRPAIALPGPGSNDDFLSTGVAVGRLRSRASFAVIFNEKAFIPGPAWKTIREGSGATVLMSDDIASVYGVARSRDAAPTAR